MSIKFGPCNNKLLSAAIDILNATTGIKWGFMQSKRKVTCVTSAEIKIKFGISGRLDHHIKTKPSGQNWQSELKFELCSVLLKYLRVNEPAHHCIQNLELISHNGVCVAECEYKFDPSTCKEVNAYQDTFTHADTSWIFADYPELPAQKTLSICDYI